MKKRWFWAGVVAIMMALACTLPFGGRCPTTITGLTVTPPAGEKDFSLEVKYYFTWDRERGNARIDCMYTAPSGNVVSIGAITPEGLDRDNEAFSKVDKLTFSIKPRDGKIEPGVYVAGCATDQANSLVTAAFTVTESAAATATPQLDATATPTPTPQQQTVPLKGQIVFDYAKAESSRPSAGGELSRVTDLCIPEINIGTDGNLSGQCEKLHITALLIDESITAQANGTVDSSGNIIFSYDVSEIGNPNGVWRISYEGEGKFTSTTQAAGTATFSYSCNSGADNLIWCWQWTSESFSGTLPWGFIVAP